MRVFELDIFPQIAKIGLVFEHLFLRSTFFDRSVVTFANKQTRRWHACASFADWLIHFKHERGCFPSFNTSGAIDLRLLRLKGVSQACCTRTHRHLSVTIHLRHLVNWRTFKVIGYCQLRDDCPVWLSRVGGTILFRRKIRGPTYACANTSWLVDCVTSSVIIRPWKNLFLCNF